MKRLALALLLAGCTAQQQQQAQTAITIVCAIESQAAPIAITVDTKAADQANIAKADTAARAACAAMRGVVVTTAAP